MPFSTSVIPSILETLSLRDLAEEAGAVFRGSGPNPSSHCPLHGGDNPTAFHLYSDGTRWHCFTRCPEGLNGGDLISFYIRWKNIDFRTALEELSLRLYSGAVAGLTPPSKLTRPITQAEPPDFTAHLNRIEQSTPLPLQYRPTSEILQRPENQSPSPAWQARAAAFIAYCRKQLLDPRIGAPARLYLKKERGHTPATWETFQLGYNPSDLFDKASRWGFPDPSSPPVYLPRGIVIPGISGGLPHYIKIRRPLHPLHVIVRSDGRSVPAATVATDLGSPKQSDFRLPQSLMPPTNPDSPGMAKMNHSTDPLSLYLHPFTVARSTGLTPDSVRYRPSKYLSVRGSRPCLFGSDQFQNHPTLILTEGEFDCILAWQLANDSSAGPPLPLDIATLGSASSRLTAPDLAALTRYTRILAVYDSDPAGDQARAYLSTFPRLKILPSPAHDLSDYFLSGSDLRTWLLSLL